MFAGKHSETWYGTEEGLPEDELFELLSVRRRRELIREPDRAGGKATLGALTDAIAAGESDEPSSHSGHKAVYVSL